jgi:hypothetical protein
MLAISNLSRPLALILVSSGLGATTTPHVTPVVELVNRTDAVRALLEGSSRYFARELPLDGPRKKELDRRTGWKPEEAKIRIFVGRDDAGTKIADAILIKVNSRHGPVEVAVGLEPVGSVRGVIVTRATEETAPWVGEVIEAGLLDAFEGTDEQDAAAAVSEVRGKVGRMPLYMGTIIAAGVERAIVVEDMASAN